MVVESFFGFSFYPVAFSPRVDHRLFKSAPVLNCCVGRKHSRGVTRKYKAVENSLDDGFWDQVYREKPYFENQVAPDGELPDEKGRMKGEFDVVAVNYEEKYLLYVEVKTNPADLCKADEQLERAEKHFEPDWSVIGQKWLEV